MPRGDATVLECARRSESVGTDSRVLRRREVVNAPAKPFCAKFFRTVNPLITAPRSAQKLRAKDIARARRHHPHRKIGVARNPHFIGIFAQHRFLRAQSRMQKIFRRVVSPASAARDCGARGARDLHTKLSGVTVIFLLL
ncbi:MAG TPA: hypothetical protein VMR17_25000 [Xanthobacteraceae bacterium]|nr:hypothetical protein [Xanthobacteraceae bacterium]